MYDSSNLWKLHDEIVSVRILCGTFYLFHCYVFSSVADVFCDCCAKQYRFLTNDSNVPPHPFNIHRTNINTVNQYLYQQVL